MIEYWAYFAAVAGSVDTLVTSIESGGAAKSWATLVWKAGAWVKMS